MKNKHWLAKVLVNMEQEEVIYSVLIYSVLIYNVLTPTEKLLYLMFEHTSREALLLFKVLLNIRRVDVLLTLLF